MILMTGILTMGIQTPRNWVDEFIPYIWKEWELGCPSTYGHPNKIWLWCSLIFYLDQISNLEQNSSMVKYPYPDAPNVWIKFTYIKTKTIQTNQPHVGNYTIHG